MKLPNTHISKFTLITSIGLIGLIGPMRAGAQTNTVPAGPQGSFLSTVQNYFSSFNTNLDSTFANERGELWVGADYVNGLNTAASLGLSYVIWRPLPLTPLHSPGPSPLIPLPSDGRGQSDGRGGPLALEAECVTRNAGIAGTILSTQAGLGAGLVLHDTKLTLSAGGGYDFERGHAYGALAISVKKALTEHTFAGLRLETQIGTGKPAAPTLSVMVGFVF